MRAVQHDLIGVDEYLAGEQLSEIKHELIYGVVYAMSGVSIYHECLFRNLYLRIGHHLRDSPCTLYSSDMKLRVDDHFFYPDLIVTCEDRDQHDYYRDSPVIIVEILSPTTHRHDRTTKREHYVTIPTLLNYVLVEQDRTEVIVLQRHTGWRTDRYGPEDQVRLGGIALTLPVADIYHRVHRVSATTTGVS